MEEERGVWRDGGQQEGDRSQYGGQRGCWEGGGLRLRAWAYGVVASLLRQMR